MFGDFQQFLDYCKESNKVLMKLLESPSPPEPLWRISPFDDSQPLDQKRIWITSLNVDKNPNKADN